MDEDNDETDKAGPSHVDSDNPPRRIVIGELTPVPIKSCSNCTPKTKKYLKGCADRLAEIEANLNLKGVVIHPQVRGNS